MARRRAKAREPTPVEVEQEEEILEQPAAEEVQSDSELSEAQDAPEEPEVEEQVQSLQFKEELSWRPAKPIPTATLFSRLETLAEELKGFEQGEVDLATLEDVKNKLVHRNLVQHKDQGVKAYTACCLIDMLRLYAPDPPYNEDQLKLIFGLFIKDILPALHDPKSSYTNQHVYVLTQLTEVEIICLLSEVPGCDELMTRLFNSTFDGVSGNSKSNTGGEIAKDVEINLTNMLVQLLEETKKSIPAAVVDSIISQFMRAAPPGGGRNREQQSNQSTLLHKTEPPAHLMAKHICMELPDVMARCIAQYFSETVLSASGFATRGARHEDDEEDGHPAGPSEADLKSLRQSHLLIRELWRAAPTVLQNVVPQIEAELAADDEHLRRIATETFGDMISGIGAAGPPPPPALEPAIYPPLSLNDESTPAPTEANVLTTPHSPLSFIQTHPTTYRNFVTRRNDKASSIRAAWVTAAGHILSTSAGGVGLSRIEETELIKGISDLLHDVEEKVRISAIKAVELFTFRDIIAKLGATGGVDDAGSLFSNLAARIRDFKPAVRVESMVLLGKLWAVGAGEIAQGHEAIITCLGGIPTRIFDALKAEGTDVKVLIDRVLFECLIPLKYPTLRKASSSSQGKAAALNQQEQDAIRAERILLMIKSLNGASRRFFAGWQKARPSYAIAAAGFVKQCEAYNGGVAIGASKKGIEKTMNDIIRYLSPFFPGGEEKVHSDMYRLAKSNNRRVYQLIKFAIESESDFQKVRRSLNELSSKLQESNAASCLDTLIPLLYRASNLIFNQNHLTPIMNISKSDKDGLGSVAQSVMTEISTIDPGILKLHSEELRKSIVDGAPSEGSLNDRTMVDTLKAYASYAKKFPENIKVDRAFNQTLMNYALYGTPHKVAKYAINILLVKNDDKSKVAATQLLQKIMKDLDYGSAHYVTRLAAISQLQRLTPSVTADADDELHELMIKKILREVRTDALDSDPSWVEETAMNEELQAKCLCLRILVNKALANAEEISADDMVMPVFKLLKTFVVQEGEFCKVKDTPLHHKKHLRLVAARLMVKLCTVKIYDDQFDIVSFNKLAEMVQDNELEVRRRFMEKLQRYLSQDKLRVRFYTILFLVAFEPVSGLKNQIEMWIRSRSRYYSEKKKPVLEAMIGRLIPLLAHHPDYSPDKEDLADFAKYFIFYLNTVATEVNLPLISKYTERVKQTRDALKPEASENLYVLCDLASAMIRKYQERQGWSFQAYPDKVGLPAGLFQALPSSEVALQIAKKQYIPDEMDETLDELLRVNDRKKKRKSVHESSEPSAKRAKSHMNTVFREKPLPKNKSSKPKGSGKKSKPRKTDTSSPVPEGDRRRSGRAQKSSNYIERNDDEDDEDMLEGVASWDYGDKADEDGSEEESGSEKEAESEEESAPEEEEEVEEEAPPPPRSAKKAAPAANGKSSKPAVKANVLRGATRSTRGKAKAKADDSDMEVDDDE